MRSIKVTLRFQALVERTSISVDDPMDSIFKQFFSEIDNVANPKIT